MSFTNFHTELRNHYTEHGIITNQTYTKSGQPEMKGGGEVEARNNNPQGSKCAHCRRSRGGDQGLLPPRLPSDKRLHRLPPNFTSSTTVRHQSSEACVQVLYYCKDDSRLKTKGIIKGRAKHKKILLNISISGSLFCYRKKW